jgi:cytochrome c oxidase accessory protein FixG
MKQQDQRTARDAPAEPVTTEQALFEVRRKIHPRAVSGWFAGWRWALVWATQILFYGLPWLNWGDRPAVLFAIEERRFFLFGLVLYPQDFFYLTGLLIISALSLFLFTAVAGRLWCGYACPQTVYTEIFMWVERRIEGDRNARMKLDKSPLSANKVARKTAKHATWLLVSFATGGAFILYWHDAPSLAQTLFAGQAPMTAYVFAGMLTLTTYALAGTMREQVCTYMCPWPRIQGALVDKDTLTITYRYERGEPRAPHKKDETWEGRGDCIDCQQCVVVCPMGIDIRDGAQLECIQCGLCIDACNGVMKKIGRPANLIAYDTDENVALRCDKKPAKPFRPLRARTMLYVVVFALAGSIMLFGLTTRSDIDISVLKDRAVPYVKLVSGDIRNAYTLKVANKQRNVRRLGLAVEGLTGARIEIIGEGLMSGAAHVTAEPDGVDRYRVLVTAPAASVVSGGATVRFVLSDASGMSSVAAPFEGPET